MKLAHHKRVEVFSPFLKLIQQYSWWSWFIYMLVTAALYSLAAHVPIRDSLVISPLLLDGQIPFVPVSAYVYITYLLLFPVLILMARKREEFSWVFAVGITCGFINALIYNVFPSMISERVVAPDASLLSMIQHLDTLRCSIPSGHVALPTSIAVTAFFMSRKAKIHDSLFWRTISIVFVIWAIGLGGSALLTKQHFIVDIFAGVVFGSTVALFCTVLAEVHRPTAVALISEWTLIFVALSIALYWQHWSIFIIVAIFIATRQHALLILFHDGVHGLVAKNSRMNDFIINTAIGVPLFIPVHVYRALHFSHHRHLGSARDPERALLYKNQPWNFKPLSSGALLRQLFGDLSGWNGIVMTFRYVYESRPEGTLDLPKTRMYSELFLQFFIIYGGLLGLFFIWPNEVLIICLLWYIPYLTVTQLLQKIRSFAEHVHKEVDTSLSCSWKTGLLGKLFIWPYNINYHREHHLHQNISWDRLPSLFPTIQQQHGKQLIAHIWNGVPKCH